MILWSIWNIWLPLFLVHRSSFLLACWQLSAINWCAEVQNKSREKRVTSGSFSGPSFGVIFEGFLWINFSLIGFATKNNSWLANYGNQIQFAGIITFLKVIVFDFIVLV